MQRRGCYSFSLRWKEKWINNTTRRWVPPSCVDNKINGTTRRCVPPRRIAKGRNGTRWTCWFGTSWRYSPRCIEKETNGTMRRWDPLAASKNKWTARGGESSLRHKEKKNSTTREVGTVEFGMQWVGITKQKTKNRNRERAFTPALHAATSCHRWLPRRLSKQF